MTTVVGIDLSGPSNTTDTVLTVFIRGLVPPGELSRFRAKIYSIGNMIVFPGRRIEGKQAINQARGCCRSVGDRFDLTLECIRLHYLRHPSSLADVLKRYADFFMLFGDFRGYVNFFLLHDLVADDCSAVNFLLPFAGFDHQSPYPDSVESFRSYIREASQFIGARNRRILEYDRSMALKQRMLPSNGRLRETS